MNTMPRADRIEIGVVLHGGKVARLDITTRRPIGIGRLAQGRCGEAVIALVPRLFALCGAAQGVAATHALAAARGEHLPPAILTAQACAVLAERLRELLCRTVTTLAGDALPALAPPLRKVVAATRRFDRAGLLEDETIDAIEQGLAALGLPPGCFDDIEACRRWLDSDAPLAVLHESLLSAGAAGFGAAAIDPLTAAEDAAVGERLLCDGPRFALRPDLDGRVPDTGPLARNAGHPLIAWFGTGLGGRLLARLIDIRGIPARLRALRRGDADPAAIADGMRLGDGIGLAATECARGRLHHLMALDPGGLISRFEILAPTEWNFHPRGPLARALEGLAVQDLSAERRRIEQLVAAIDPCVGFDVRFREAAHA